MRRPQEILDAARSRWPAVLRAEAAGDSVFPLVIPFGRPSTTSDFGAIRADLTSLAAAEYGWQIDWEEISTRKWGNQRWPRRVSFDSIESLAHALESTEELRSFREALVLARLTCPKLEPWLKTRAHRIPELLSEWRDLVCVCSFFDANPFPNCFVRQLPIPVGTKFIEEHSGILGELLTVVLGDRANAEGLCFEERFHLRLEPAQVRFRFLDAGLRARFHWPVMDCTISVEDLAGIHWTIPRTLIVENKAVFLCLPDVPDTLAILGSGKAASLLPSCGWLHDSDVVYWGDCDEAGFGILSSMRAKLPGVRSIFMDSETWKRWNRFAVLGRKDLGSRYDHLTAVESEALAAVMAGGWLLEQERIPLQDAEEAIKKAFAGTGSMCSTS
jgi:hypothetical protein